jgi:hypothetical protein
MRAGTCRILVSLNTILNMKTRVFLALAAFTLTFAACQKENDDTEDGGTTENFQPTSAGSTWQYNSTTSGTFSETATGTDTTIDGQKYAAFDNSEGGRRYVNNNNGIYTTYGGLPQFPQLDTTISLLYLKDAPAGTNWDQVSVYNGIPITLTYTIASRDGEKDVNGTNFKDVIALDFTIGAPNPITGQNTTIATGKQFYAKGVGAIASTLHLNVGTVNINDSTYLVSYDIK